MSVHALARVCALCLFASTAAVWSCSSSDLVSAPPPASSAGSHAGVAGARGGASPVGSAGSSSAGAASSGAGMAGTGATLSAAGSGVLGTAGGTSGESGGAGVASNAGGASTGAGGAGVAGASALPGFGGAPSDKPKTVEVGVRNNCGFSIWIHGEGNGGVLGPDDQELKPKASAWYDAPKSWSAARVTAYSDGPRKNELDKVEMTLVNDPAAGVVLNYNVTYVDWLGLPVEIIGTGGGADCKPVGCYVKQSDVLNGCPSGLLDGKKCLSPRSYCLDPTHSATPQCNSLNAEITKCVQTKDGCAHAAGATTAEVFACSGKFSEDPKWCAALNRHMLDAPESTNKSLYYATDPYNTYSKWVHQVCPGIYAFAYDDYPAASGESGFHACTQGKELDITFCPAG